jgi:hypothetical protein
MYKLTINSRVKSNPALYKDQVAEFCLLIWAKGVAAPCP